MYQPNRSNNELNANPAPADGTFHAYLRIIAYDQICANGHQESAAFIAKILTQVQTELALDHVQSLSSTIAGQWRRLSPPFIYIHTNRDLIHIWTSNNSFTEFCECIRIVSLCLTQCTVYGLPCRGCLYLQSSGESRERRLLYSLRRSGSAKRVDPGKQPWAGCLIDPAILKQQEIGENLPTILAPYARTTRIIEYPISAMKRHWAGQPKNAYVVDWSGNISEAAIRHSFTAIKLHTIAGAASKVSQATIMTENTLAFIRHCNAAKNKEPWEK